MKGMTVGLKEEQHALQRGKVLDALPRLKAAAAGRVGPLSRLVGLLVSAGCRQAALSLAREAYDAGRYGEAETLGQAALDAGLQEAPVYYLLAASARAGGRLQAAADLARVGIALDSAPDAARRDLAALLIEVGQPAEAVRALEAIPQAKRDCRARETLGLAYALAGRQDAARQAFRGLLVDFPDHSFASRALARLAPPPLDVVLDRIASGLDGPLAVVFACLRKGAASEELLAQALAAAGYRRPLVKALVRDLAARTQAGSTPLVWIEGSRIELRPAVLDATQHKEEPQ